MPSLTATQEGRLFYMEQRNKVKKQKTKNKKKKKKESTKSK